MTVFVTGGAGYIGSHTCKLLSESGEDIVVLDNLSTGYAEFLKWGVFEHVDITNTARLFQLFLDYQPSAVIHFAASAYVGESVSDPMKYYNNNVVGSINLINAAIASGVNHFVFSSSCATYGVPQRGGITESHPQIPINPYGFTKLVVERTLADVCRAGKIRSVCLRYFNACGASKDSEIGELHEPETHLIPLCIEAALCKRELSVFGTDYPTPDGSAIRDYVHVDDLASAHLASLEFLRRGNESGAFNLGTGSGLSVLQIIRAVEEYTGTKIPFKNEARRIGDPAVLVANADLAKTTLNWSPKYSDITTILETAVRWFSIARGL